MKLAFCAIAVVAAFQPQDKWEPYKFKAGEHYEYKIVSPDESDASKRKETSYGIDIRKKGDDDVEIVWTIKTVMKKSELGEKVLLGGMGVGASPLWTAVNPLYLAFVSQVKLKENDKTNLMGAGTIQVGAKETIGGRTGFPLKLLVDKDGKDVVAWEATIDPELALPIKSVTYDDDGKEQYRMELTTFKKD